MDEMSAQARMRELRGMPRGRLRSTLVRRLRTVGGSVAEAARRLGIEREALDDLLARADAEGAPAEVRAETVVELQPSPTFDRWFASAG